VKSFRGPKATGTIVPYTFGAKHAARKGLCSPFSRKIGGADLRRLREEASATDGFDLLNRRIRKLSVRWRFRGPSDPVYETPAEDFPSDGVSTGPLLESQIRSATAPFCASSLDGMGKKKCWYRSIRFIQKHRPPNTKLRGWQWSQTSLRVS